MKIRGQIKQAMKGAGIKPGGLAQQFPKKLAPNKPAPSASAPMSSKQKAISSVKPGFIPKGF